MKYLYKINYFHDSRINTLNIPKLYNNISKKTQQQHQFDERIKASTYLRKETTNHRRLKWHRQINGWRLLLLTRRRMRNRVLWRLCMMEFVKGMLFLRFNYFLNFFLIEESYGLSVWLMFIGNRMVIFFSFVQIFIFLKLDF